MPFSIKRGITRHPAIWAIVFWTLLFLLLYTAAYSRGFIRATFGQPSEVEQAKEKSRDIGKGIIGDKAGVSFTPFVAVMYADGIRVGGGAELLYIRPLHLDILAGVPLKDDFVDFKRVSVGPGISVHLTDNWMLGGSGQYEFENKRWIGAVYSKFRF